MAGKAKSKPAAAEKPAKPVRDEAAIIKGALASLAAGQSLRSFCIANNLAYSTTWELLNPQGGDNSAYARAREIGTHYLADECLDISDGIEEALDQGVEKLLARIEGVSPELIGAAGISMPDIGDLVKVARVRIDTRKQLIGKWNEKDYGEKKAVALSGGLNIDKALAELDDDA